MSVALAGWFGITSTAIAAVVQQSKLFRLHHRREQASSRHIAAAAP
jgi:hypothetical protein